MKGVDIVQTTPFNKDGSLDLEGMRANTRWLLGRPPFYTPLEVFSPGAGRGLVPQPLAGQSSSPVHLI